MKPAPEIPAATVSAQNWQLLEAGILQRARLLDRVMADVYGPQTLLTQGLLPAALVLGEPGYLRALHGVRPVDATYLQMVAFDLARSPEGHWRVLSQHTQAPSVLGVWLDDDGAQHLGDICDAVLTAGPDHPCHAEHAHLAHTLNRPLIEGCDLIVRDQCLYLKALGGLVPVRGLLKCMDDEFLDPLELRADSVLGVPGLLQVMRAGNVQVFNAPGSALLESPALSEFLPAMCHYLLGEALVLPCAPISPVALPATLRVFAVSNGAQSWRVIPREPPTTQPEPPPTAAAHPHQPLVTRRAAENLYWLGRYTERADNSARLAQLTLTCLHAQAPPTQHLLQWLGLQAIANTLVLPTAPVPTDDPQAFERALIASLDSHEQATSVGYQLRAMLLAGAHVRERFLPEHWWRMQCALEQFAVRCNGGAPAHALATLQATRTDLAAIAALQTTPMVHDDGWQLLHVGRLLERFWFTCTALLQGLQTTATQPFVEVDILLTLLDSATPTTGRGQYSGDRTALLATLVDMLICDPDNPRALGQVTHSLRDGLAGLGSLMQHIPDPAVWQRAALCTSSADGTPTVLMTLLRNCQQGAYLISQDLSQIRFADTVVTCQSPGV